MSTEHKKPSGKNRPNKPDSDGYVKRMIRRGGFKKTGWQQFAKEELSRLDAERQKQLDEGVTEWMPESIYDCFDRAGLDRIFHLAPYLDTIQKIPHEEVRALLSTPPQHGKTTTTLIALAWLLLVQPGKKHAYITYSQAQTADKCKDFQNILRKMGIGFTASKNVITRSGPLGGSVRFTSVEGQLTGQTLNGLAIIDDPIKGAQEARSSIERDNAYRFFVQNLMTREFGHLSVVVIMTRWDSDDLIGRLIKQKWTYINIPAICDTEDDPLNRKIGEALWPQYHPAEKLLQTKENNPREFAAMYMGDPNPEGIRLFNEETTFSKWYPSKTRVYYGIDVSYGKGKRSDYSTCVRLVLDLETALVMLDRVIRLQGDMSIFCEEVKKLQDTRDGPVFWATGGPNEHLVIADLLRARGIRRLTTYSARISKRARSQDAADAWNLGRIVVPAKQDNHMRDAIEEITRFTGDERNHDDCVDALCSAFKPVKAQLTGDRSTTNIVSDIVEQRKFFNPPPNVRDPMKYHKMSSMLPRTLR